MGYVVGEGGELSVMDSLSAFWRRMPIKDLSIVDHTLEHRRTRGPLKALTRLILFPWDLGRACQWRNSEEVLIHFKTVEFVTMKAPLSIQETGINSFKRELLLFLPNFCFLTRGCPLEPTFSNLHVTPFFPSKHCLEVSRELGKAVVSTARPFAAICIPKGSYYLPR